MVLGIEMDGLREEVDGRVPFFGRKGFVPLGFQQLSPPGLRQSCILRTTATRTSAMVDGDGDEEDTEVGNYPDSGWTCTGL